jgi:hypothetical protein
VLESHYIVNSVSPLERRPLVPRELRLVSPLFNVSPAQYRARHTVLASAISTLTRRPPYSQDGIASVSASVDAFISVDGFGGPDSLGLLKRFRCLRGVERELAVGVLSMANGNAGKIVAFLRQNLRANPGPASDSETDPVCAEHRVKVAQALLNTERSGGLQPRRKQAEVLANQVPNIDALGFPPGGTP